MAAAWKIRHGICRSCHSAMQRYRKVMEVDGKCLRKREDHVAKDGVVLKPSGLAEP